MAVIREPLKPEDLDVEWPCTEQELLKAIEKELRRRTAYKAAQAA